MKRFGTLFLAAVLGSLCTFGAMKWLTDDNPGVRLEYLTGAPVTHVSYKDKSGEVEPLDFTGVAEEVVPAVVHVRSTYSRMPSQTQYDFDPFRDFFGPQFPDMKPQPSEATGSGVIISADGYIVTNNHVVRNADIVEVILNDNRSYKAEVIGTDPDTDIALIRINEKNLPHLSFVDSDQARIGEWVLAIGNPYNLNSTVTAGIISAKKRSINLLGTGNNSSGSNTQGSTAIESFIQTDAAINPGNSGGALVNMSGGLVGINTAIASPTGSYSGYGFAVPSNIVSKIVQDLLKYGVVQRGWLGVSIMPVNSELAKKEDLKVNEGAYVGDFAEKSAAKEAGIEKGDVVTKIDNTPIKSSAALIEYIGTHRPGDKVNITVNRHGKEYTYPATLKSREGSTNMIKAEDTDAYASLGAELEEVSPTVLKQHDLTAGVRVKALGNGKLARYTDIHEGFIITKVNDEPVKSVKEFNELMKKFNKGDLVILSGIYEDFPREFNYAFRM